MPKKILLVINSHQFTAKHRIPLIQHFASLGYNVKVIVLEKSAAQLELVKNNIQTINWNISRKGLNPLYEAISIYNLYKIYKKEFPDVVIHATIKPVIYGTLAAYLSNMQPIINLVTGLGPAFIPKNWYNKITKVFIMQIYNFIFRFIPQTINVNKSTNTVLYNLYHEKFNLFSGIHRLINKV